MRLSRLYGMRIYNDHGRFVGEIDDVMIEDREGMVVGLVFGRRGSTVLSVPFGSILAIGDIVLVQTKKPQPQPGAQA